MTMIKGRWQLPVLLALFVVPTLAAMVLVFTDWRPAGFTNNGDLVQPAEQLSPGQWRSARGEPLQFAGDWLVVVPQTSACGDDCEQRLDTLSRARIALDRDIDRVQLLLLQPADGPVDPADIPEGIRVMEADAGTVAELNVHEGTAMAAHIVDYRGYHVMRYVEPLDGAGLLDDLEKLLRLSKEEAERRAQEEATAE